MLQPVHPTDRVCAAILGAMQTLNVTDVELFIRGIREFRYGLEEAYHAAGAPYGVGNGWGMLRWTEEQINQMQIEGVLPRDGDCSGLDVPVFAVVSYSGGGVT